MTPPRTIWRPATLAAAILAAGSLLALAAEAPRRGPAVQLVETRPVEYAIGNPALPEALPTWLELFRGARRAIDVEQFYLSVWPGEPMDAVLAELGRAAARGVKIRLVLDARMYRTYPRTADSLAKVANWQVRLVDFGRIAGGVQHAKFFLIDGEASFVGSQNFDWRALKHIHELGILVRDPRVAGDFQRVFEMDWDAATPVGTPADTTRRFVPPPRRPGPPLPYRIANAPGDTMEVWPSFTPTRFIPDSTMDDLRRIVSLIHAARSEVVVQVLNYSPESRGEKLPAIDDALRRAAARGVKVKLVVSDWVMGGGHGLTSLQQLVRVPGIEVKLSTVPEWSGGYIPFARVEHCKYMVVDTLATWVGTDNWEPGYFTGSRNLAVTVRHRGLARQARAIFETSWNAPGAAKLDPVAKYPPKVRGEDPPPGRKKYGG